MAGDTQAYHDAAPSLQRNADALPPGKRRWLALLAVLIAHLVGLYWALRNAIELPDRDVGRPIEIALIDEPASPAIPELQKPSPSPRRSPSIVPAMPGIPAQADREPRRRCHRR